MVDTSGTEMTAPMIPPRTAPDATDATDNAITTVVQVDGTGHDQRMQHVHQLGVPIRRRLAQRDHPRDAPVHALVWHDTTAGAVEDPDPQAVLREINGEDEDGNQSRHRIRSPQRIPTCASAAGRGLRTACQSGTTWCSAAAGPTWRSTIRGAA
jgi:hypothetical protein